MKKITNLEYGTLLYFLNKACFTELTLQIILNISNQDSWISIIIGILFGIIPFSIYEYLKNKYPNYNYITLNKKLFKGNLINILILIGCLTGLICTFWILVNFTNSLFLYRTDTWIISIALIIPIYYAGTKNIHIISKISLLLFYLTAIFSIIIFTGLFNKLDINNIKPLFENNILYSSVIFLCFNISKIFFINIIPKSQIRNNKPIIDYLVYFITCIIMIIITFTNISIFGIKLSKIYEYPAFQLLKRVNILGVIDRIESILAIEGIIAIFIEMTIIFCYTRNIIKLTLKTKTDKYINIFICLTTLIISNLIFKNRQSGELFFKGPLLYIICFICIILPFITLLKSFNNPSINQNKINSSTQNK